ncbi:MAG: MFS transporter [Clostridia bacterium]|nr:MFS transporter [Clostridia bacterium]
MMTPNYKRTKLACYTAYFTMSSIFSLPPLLFVTLREMYGISYTLLGTLVLTNFCTQLTVDLIFTLFSKHFNVQKVVRVMPLITSVGLFVYAVVPMLLPQFAYGGLLLGTVIFSIAAGLSEVLLSPVIAALPSDNPQRDMSMLHSLYAFGVFTVVVISTLFLRFVGAQHWMYLTMFWAALPVLSAVLFMLSPMPDMGGESTVSGVEGTRRRTVGLALCVGCIFFGSCAENAMSNWLSGYMETALGLDKTLGDILGVAMFAILLGVARISYAKFGKRIMPVLMVGMIGAVICYGAVGLSHHVAVGFTACVLTGLFTSMLWPGTLIMMEEKIPHAGVAAYALMASGGDLGASVAPQLLGIVVDQVAESHWAARLGATLSLSAEQVGLRAGMLVTAIFPLLGILLLLVCVRYFRSNREKQAMLPEREQV